MIRRMLTFSPFSWYVVVIGHLNESIEPCSDNYSFKPIKFVKTIIVRQLIDDSTRDFVNDFK